MKTLVKILRGLNPVSSSGNWFLDIIYATVFFFTVGVTATIVAYI